MKRCICVLLTVSLTIFLFSGCSLIGASADRNQSQNEKLSVYTSIYPMYDFASKIGGDKVNVVNMVPTGIEPHDWEPAAFDIMGLEKATVFIYNGAGMEHWVGDVLDSLQNEALTILDASTGIKLVEGHGEHEGKNGHEDESYDPHVWLDPMNAKMQMNNIKNSFIDADPDNTDYYEANYSKYSAELDVLDKKFMDTLASYTERNIIVSHEAFGYLCAAYDLNQIGIEGLSADYEPDPAKMSDIIDFALEHDVKVIFFEELVSPKVAETIAKEIGAKTAVLNPIEGLNEQQELAGDDYFSIMLRNLDELNKALH